MIINIIHKYNVAFPLILANIIVLIGVLLWGWELINVIFLYWVETIILSLFSIAKIILLIYVNLQNANGFLAKAVNLVGYLILGLIYLSFLVFLLYMILWFHSPTTKNGLQMSIKDYSFVINYTQYYILAIIVIFYKHGSNFIKNYIGKKEFGILTIEQITNQTFIHLSIFTIFFAISIIYAIYFGKSTYFIVIIIVGKLAANLFYYKDSYDIQKIVSPNGVYFIIYRSIAGNPMITIKNNKNQVLVADILKPNLGLIYKGLHELGLRWYGKYNWKLDDWVTSNTFTIKILPANGMVYKVDVDAPTGKIKELSLKRLK